MGNFRPISLACISIISLLILTNCSSSKNIDAVIDKKINDKIDDAVETSVDAKLIKGGSKDQEIDKLVENKIDKAIEQKKNKPKENRGVDKANTNTYVTEYDFQKGTFDENNLSPSINTPMVFKITNINRLAYEITIKSQNVAIADEFFKEEIDNALKDNKPESSKTEEPSKKTITQPELGNIDIKKNINGEEINTTEIKSLKDKIDSLKNILTSLIFEKENNFKRINEYEAKINSLEKKDDNLIAKEKDELTKFKIKNDSLQQEIDLNQQKIIDLNDLLTKELKANEAILNNFNDLNMSYVKILEAYQKIHEVEEKYQNFHTLALSPLLDEYLYKEIRSDEKFILHNLTKYRSDVNEFNKAINHFNTAYHKSINNWSLFDQITSAAAKDNVRMKFQLLKDEVDKVNNAFIALNILSKLRKVEAIDAVLKRKEAYEMVSSPIQPLEDYVTYDISIKHKDGKDTYEYNNNKEFSYTEYTNGGVRFDFSTGAVFNLIWNNDTYGLQDVEIDGVNKKKVVVEDNNQFMPSLAGIFHTSFRRSGTYAFGLSLGASLNIETFQLNSLFPGVSLLIGKKQKFIFTVGPSFRQVEELKDIYKENEVYDVDKFNDETELTSKQFKIGLFFGITYNLTQKQRGKFKIGSN